MNALNMKLMNVTLKVEQLCAATPRPSISQRPQEISGSNLMLTLLHKIETMEETLNQMQRKLSVVENRPTVIMEEEFRPQIPQVYRTTTPRTMTGDERTEQQCVTRQEVEEMLNASVKLVVGSIEEALGQCASEDKVKEVLDEVVEVQEGVEQVAAVTGQAREEAQRCPLEEPSTPARTPPFPAVLGMTCARQPCGSTDAACRPWPTTVATRAPLTTNCRRWGRGATRTPAEL
ncbi:hypothetical protein O3P69_012224 [Scylla paramamosain]|uniref:Uncharacterized protein n=1 Tax=Scylla paramamosain TaxID=85552 RepID=A0AAW0TC66_SCYPA